MITIPPRATRAQLIQIIQQLEVALGWYCDATDVESYGYETQRDTGGVARRALGYGDHAPGCAWLVGIWVEPTWDAETGDVIDPGVSVSSDVCTCGLHDQITADLNALVATLQGDPSASTMTSSGGTDGKHQA